MCVKHTHAGYIFQYIFTQVIVIYLHISLTENPSGTITSDDTSSAIQSGGITTSKYPIIIENGMKKKNT